MLLDHDAVTVGVLLLLLAVVVDGREGSVPVEIVIAARLLMMDRADGFRDVRHWRAVAVVAGHGHVHGRVHAGQIVGRLMVVLVMMLLLDLLDLLDRTCVAADVRGCVLRGDAFTIYANQQIKR